MKGKALQVTLKNIKRGETYDIWNLLPDQASGKEWLQEIKDTAQAISEYLDADTDYTLEDLRDFEGQFAERETEDSYKNIHDRNHALSLWAIDDIQEMVSEIFELSATNSLTDLESNYLYCAMRILWGAVADQAFENTEDLEEANA